MPTFYDSGIRLLKTSFDNLRMMKLMDDLGYSGSQLGQWGIFNEHEETMTFSIFEECLHLLFPGSEIEYSENQNESGMYNFDFVIENPDFCRIKQQLNFEQVEKRYSRFIEMGDDYSAAACSVLWREEEVLVIRFDDWPDYMSFYLELLVPASELTEKLISISKKKEKKEQIEDEQLSNLLVG
ncbi:hypothetical protein CA598_06395 [Paenibacillus sp. VTT E-133291]|nr:hypothetical protein CA598_06395 [Paenibacillus sp. VTT E-133291]